MNDGTTGARADAVELLTSQHHDVAQLWTMAQAARDKGEAALATDNAERIITMLSQHDAIETQYLYPALRDVGAGGDDLAERSLQEHQEVRELLKAADGKVAEQAGWDALAQAMAKVATHVQEEESQIFPTLRKVGGEELYELGDAMQAAMATAPTHPHPSTPNNPVAAAVVGGAAAVVDRVRDALKKVG